MWRPQASCVCLLLTTGTGWGTIFLKLSSCTRYQQMQDRGSCFKSEYNAVKSHGLRKWWVNQSTEGKLIIFLSSGQEKALWWKSKAPLRLEGTDHVVLPSNTAASEQAFPSTATLSHTAEKAVWSSPFALLDLPLSRTLGGIIKQFKNLESLACLWWYVLFVQCNYANSPPKRTSVPVRSGLEGLQYVLYDNTQNSQILCGTPQLADRHLTSIPLKHIVLWNKCKATYENFRQ